MTATKTIAKPEEVAEWLQITVEQLAGLRKRGTGPKSMKVDRVTVRYVWSDVFAWANARREGR